MNNEYYKKYLKYKTKYLELSKQVGGEPIVIRDLSDIPKTWYNLDNHTLFCTSDLEGGNPFDNLRSSEPGKPSTDVKNALTNAFEINNGLITNLKPNTAFACLGDLLDNNPFSIRLMESMIKLKEKHPHKVILIGGNRDFNKIRMGIELYIHNTAQNNSLPWTGTTTIQELLAKLGDTTNQFKFRYESIPDYLQKVGEWDDTINGYTDKKGKTIPPQLEMYKDKTKISERLNAMYKHTLGIKDGTKHMKTELAEMLQISLNDYSPEVVDKLLCTIHMLMAFDWCQAKLPPYLSRFNALYQKYLTFCHVIAGFTMNDKTGILSHGSIPINTEGKGGLTKRSLTFPFGYNAENTLFKSTTKSSLPHIISMIELEKIELINEYKTLRDTQYNYKDFPMVTKFVHLTAGTKDDVYPQASFQNSPVVWGNQEKDLTKYPDISFRLSRQDGGAPGFQNWVDNDNKKQHLILDEGKDNIDYNIFGHSPAYYNPIYYRKKDTLHVNLDISKAELQSNLYTFAFLVINNKETKLIGRIAFTKIDSNNTDGTVNYKNNTGYATQEIIDKLSNHDHYYVHKIEDGSVNLSMTDKILGLPYKAGRGEGYNKLITN
jgi:hypothetical protein